MIFKCDNGEQLTAKATATELRALEKAERIIAGLRKVEGPWDVSAAEAASGVQGILDYFAGIMPAETEGDDATDQAN